jgi:dual specificity tyrosine-phosphorylation-regulated kinase 2/3/4
LVPDDCLTQFEKTEIEEFEEVWFVAPASVKYLPTKLERLVNNGFDDQEGYYRF